jgi:hypothetical protein
MRGNLILRIVIILAIYFGLTYYGGDMGRKLLYPIRLFVTFLHEFGHAIGAVLTGGWVEEVQINQDGSGWTRSANGNRPITIMGGYLGSAFFGNLLFYVGARAQQLVKPLMVLVIISMLVTGFYWFNSLFTTGVLVLFSVFLFFIAFKTNLGQEVLMFLGLASVIYIIQDFNVGPTSDLKAYEEEMVFIPAQVWMYIWLGVAILLLLFNLKLLLRSPTSDYDRSTQAP